MRKCLGICICILLASGLFQKAEADGVWTYTDNETLYERMLGYLNETQQVLMGEPYYFMVQQFIVEVKAAHLKDRYAWLGQTHRFCNQLEALYPPAIEHVSVMAEDRYERLRRSIVKLRDYPMHEMSITSADDDNVVPPADQVTAFHAANKQWLLQKRDAFLDYLTNEPRPKDGSIQILKLYSSGYVFRTANVCVGVDLNWNEAFYSLDRYEELVSALDVLFITHAHGDHYDATMVRKMLEAGKPVVMTKDLASSAPSASKVIWNKEVSSPVQIIPGVSAMAGMAAQGHEPCLLYHVDMDGWKFVAVGDNSYQDLESFYHGRPLPDIAVLPIFQGVGALDKHLHECSNDEGVSTIYFSAHENEYHHAISGRIGYDYMYSNMYNGLRSNSLHVVAMDCGEHMTLSK